jgi:hypothetical protein
MSAKPENTFIASVHKHLPLKNKLHREKMNNPYSSGTADVWYSGDAGDLWIEYKFLPRLPQRGVVDPTKLLTALQLQWLNGRYDEGRNVAVVIGCPTGGVLLRDRLWGCELPSSQFASLIRSRDDLAEWVVSQTIRSV